MIVVADAHDYLLLLVLILITDETSTTAAVKGRSDVHHCNSAAVL